METLKVVCFAGGVGGARLVHGFYQAQHEPLTVVVNTGDDFEHLGLTICPDIDTVLYTLSGMADVQRGWGVANDSHRALDMVKKLGGDDWFFLSDTDLGLHIWRTQSLTQGRTLTQVTEHQTRALGVTCRVLPMTDAPVRTRLRLEQGWVDFQDYFVRQQHSEPVLELAYTGASRATASAPEAVYEADLVVLCPSNPFLSIQPMLASGYLEPLQKCSALKVAVSPIIGGEAVKGPAAEMLSSLGHEVSALGVARMYADWLDVFVLDEKDAELAAGVEALGLKCWVLPTWMKGLEDRTELARNLLQLAQDDLRTRTS